MTTELIVNTTDDGYRIALLQDGKIIEYHIDDKKRRFTVGDIILGTVERSAASLNAAFIDIGDQRGAFLHYSDLGSRFNAFKAFTASVLQKGDAQFDLNDLASTKELDKLGNITQVLRQGEKILVQVTKEALASKGFRVSCDLSLAGRYLILIPFSNTINISQKIEGKAEQQRLKNLITAIKPEGFGIIVRTIAQGKSVAKFDKELQGLLKRWEEGVENLKRALPKDRIIGEVNRASSILRDLLNASFDNVVVDNKELYQKIKAYLHEIAPEKERIVQLYRKDFKVFERFGIERQLKSLFGQVVDIAGGGYLVIEHTEAMHVIDVNSGSRITSGIDQEAMALAVNLAASVEVARQLRLRDMGGIVVVDYIDMKKSEHKQKVYQKLKEGLKADRAKTHVLPLTRIGLMQITRERVRPAVNVVNTETCPSCQGSGKTGPTISTPGQIELKLQHLVKKKNKDYLNLFIHPYLYAYFTQGLFSRRLQWLFRHKRWVSLISDSSLPITDYRFTNRRGTILAQNPKRPPIHS